MPFYPVYALLFADSGVSAAGISALFALWSAATFLLEIPSGVWADVVSRRRLLTAAPVLDAAGYALWTLAPSFWSFTVGFVLLGAGGALRSGALQALVYAELDRLGATAAYPRLVGRGQAAGGAAGLLATALAGPLVAVGGYRAVGAVSVTSLLLCAAAGRALPDRPPPRGAARPGAQSDYGAVPGDNEDQAGLAVLRAGLAVVRRSAPVRRALLLAAALTGVPALDEFLPLLVRDTGAPPAAVPLLVLAVSAASTLGGLLAGRGGRLHAGLLAAAAGLLALGAGSGTPAGIAGVAAAFGIFYWALARADARLQGSLDDNTRATVTSVSGAGAEAVGVVTFAAYGAGADGLGLAPRWLFAAAALPYLLLVVPAALRRVRARSRSRSSPGR